MYKIVHAKQFKKDFKKYSRSGLDFFEFKEVYNKLAKGELLERKYCDHPLKGRYKGVRECHLKPDCLIIYKLDKINNRIIFERIGSHSELFK